ncbi:E3 ubiquitin-protein ligase TRIM7-like isoform X2 [Heteronotia binoei]|uniref:E3 ubiquitin-protein ligase TRIM7-like isoform X2 n=1 Tax=Heteronotia binoei TaxID=13085 RepID=UPI00292D518B|nr:E3 ubiquitin-protein ligase TRIM7-like isoform X2 [Heteronotia binoei]XP_060095099.1 E3 ubiquitin-protein ligase TRIM7-like isoform X2 [Heteronotia binoei]
MDTELFKTKLQDEATCSICLKYFIEPAILDCGHNFCHSCIHWCWMEFPNEPACPQCRKGVMTKNCRPNRALANVVELVKQLNNLKEDSIDKICRKHPEPSEVVFCKEDQVSLCLVCERGEQHRCHHVVPLKEAAQEYKDRFHSCIKALLNEKNEILTYQLNSIRECEELMKRIEAEKQKTLEEFRQLHQFLTDQETCLLAKIQAVARDIGNKKNDTLYKLSAELVSLQNSVWQLEEKCQQPDNKLLQDAQRILENYEKRPKFKPSEAIPLKLKWATWELCDLNVLLEGAAKHFRSTLQGGYQLHRANVTLDPESAHPQLLLSSDGKSLRWTEMEQDMPETPKRFIRHFCAVGHQEFTAGRHFWDVAVGGEENWAVGVTTSSADRKGFNGFVPEEGFFIIGWEEREDTSLNIPELAKELKVVRVSVNCAGGQVVFYDAERADKVFCFSNTSFHRETLQPFFWLRGETQLSLCTN